MDSSTFQSGFSNEARVIAEQFREQNRTMRQSLVLGKQSAFDELADVWEECKSPNWDGYNAFPVTQDTLRNAYCVIESLPVGSPSPTLGAEPDGEITLEWYRSPYRTLSVSVSPDGDLHYAALCGPNKIYGTSVFLGDIPDVILGLIEQVSRR
jgi:hypothetical protein